MHASLKNLSRRSRAWDRVTEGQVWQKCGKEGYPGARLEMEVWAKLLQTDSAPSTLARAAGTLPECRRKERPPGIFHLHERGAGWSRTGPAHVPFPKSSIGGPAPIFWPNFLGKNFGNKNRVVSIPEQRLLRVGGSDTPDRTAVLAPLVTIFLAAHAATPPATAPSLAQDKFCTQVGPPCLACLPTTISCSWRRSSL